MTEFFFRKRTPENVFNADPKRNTEENPWENVKKGSNVLKFPLKQPSQRIYVSEIVQTQYKLLNHTLKLPTDRKDFQYLPLLSFAFYWNKNDLLIFLCFWWRIYGFRWKLISPTLLLIKIYKTFSWSIFYTLEYFFFLIYATVHWSISELAQKRYREQSAHNCDQIHGRCYYDFFGKNFLF